MLTLSSNALHDLWYREAEHGEHAKQPLMTCVRSASHRGGASDFRRGLIIRVADRALSVDVRCLKLRRKSRPVGRLPLAVGNSSDLLLHLDGEGFGEFEAESGLGGQDNLLLPGVGRSRGSRTCTQGCTDECAFATAGKTSDQGSASSAAADEGGGTFPLALEVAADRTCLHVVAAIVRRHGLKDEPEYGGTLEAALWHGFDDST